MRIDKHGEALAVGGETMASLAHDLRTPMSSVSGAAQMALLYSSQGKTVDKQLREILAAVEAMDMLLGRMCEGDGRQTISAKGLESALCAVMQPRAQRKEQLLHVDLTALDGAAIQNGDSLLRVLLNLVSNAVKYTQPGGEICVKACRTAGVSTVTVSDNGMGMKREFMHRMFEPFERAKESCDQPGRGLGLAIVRRLVQGMGGSMLVRSAWGRGTAFTLRLPEIKTGRLVQ